MVAEMQAAGTTAHCSSQQQENVPATLQRPKLEEECPPESSSSIMMENGNIIQANSQFGIDEKNNANNGDGRGGNVVAEDGIKTENLVSSNLELFFCTNCGLPIHDRFLYQVLDQQFYHEKCLHCSVCSEPFATAGSCFSRNQLLFCRDHFFVTFGPKCARCSAPIGERTIVRRANQHIYHLDCFQCIVCKRELNTGDQFYLIPMDGRLVCRQDFENAQKESAEMDYGNKRPRTTISAKSLETLKQAYQCSSKPARHVREQLATQTGLDMRVVQVWFQNRRAKEKRLKKDANRRWAAQQANGGGGGDCRIGSNGTSTGGNGSGPGSVPSSSGMHGIMFGRAGTLDSDSGASNNDAESPIYSIYTNPSDVDVDVNSSNDLIYPDQNGAIFLATSDASSAPGQSQQQPQGMGGQQQQNGQHQGGGGGGEMSALMPGIQRQHSDQQQMSPHHQQQQQQQQTPPIPPQPQSHPPQQLYTLEQLEVGTQMGSNGGTQMVDPRTPISQSNAQIGILSASGIVPSSQHSQPGTPQQQQQMPQNGQPIFSPHQMICAADLMNEANGVAASNGGTLLSDQQQQYLLAAAFGPPPPQMPQMGQFMMSSPAPESAFYHHPSMGHPQSSIAHQMAATMKANGQPPPSIIGHHLGPHPHFSPLSMQIMHSGHHYHQNGQQISQ